MSTNLPDEGTVYDALVIGAGFSGMSAALRLGRLGRRVLLLERHSLSGGLNSYYRKGGRFFDVGLHALTNAGSPAGFRTALDRALRQLRLSRKELCLLPQRCSRSVSSRGSLRFDNELEHLIDSVRASFPGCVDALLKVIAELPDFGALDKNQPYCSTREFLRERLGDEALVELLLCPVMFYGSASENDIDFKAFAILFRSIFVEGMARPEQGVRSMIKALEQGLKASGVERKMGMGVRRLRKKGRRCEEVELDNGSLIRARWILSSAGLVETQRLLEGSEADAAKESIGRLSFCETFNIFTDNSVTAGEEGGTIFYHWTPTFEYRRPEELVDAKSGVICFPKHFGEKTAVGEGQMRVTCLANHELWTTLPEDRYRAEKERAFPEMLKEALRACPGLDPLAIQSSTIATDMYTPRTIEHYTGKLGGAVYGSPQKKSNGGDLCENVLLCGTDQGYLGIVGSMLSGVMMANRIFGEMD